MSHTTTIKSVKITDINALHAAVQELQAKGVKCQLVQNEVPRMYYDNQHGKCEHVLRLDDSPYDVGFEKQEDGSFSPVFDEWASQVGNQIGADVNACAIPRDAAGRAQHQIGQLMQGYAKHAAINAASAQGYYVEDTTTDENGNVHLTLGGM